MVNEQVYELIYLIHFNLDAWLQAGYHLKTVDGASLTKIDQVDRAIQAGNLAAPPAACLGCLQLETKELQNGR